MEKSKLSPIDRLLKFIREQDVQPIPLSVISRNLTRVFRNSDDLYSNLLFLQKAGIIKIEHRLIGHKATLISLCDKATQEKNESTEKQN